MIDQTLVDELAATKYLPADAIARATAAPSSVAPALLGVLDAAANGDSLSEAQENLLFWGIHLLGAARDERAFAPLMRLLRRSGEELEVLLGDAATVTLPKIAASVFDGSAGLLQETIANRDVDQFLRNSLLGAMTFLTWDGRIDTTDTTAFLERFDDRRLADPDDFAWDGWQQSIALLGLRDLAPRVEAAWRDGRVSHMLTDKKWFREALAAAKERPRDRERFAHENLGYIEDVVAELAWVPSSPADESGARESVLPGNGYRPVEPVINPFRHVGRNDPCPCGSGRKAKKCCMAA